MATIPQLHSIDGRCRSDLSATIEHGWNRAWMEPSMDGTAIAVKLAGAFRQAASADSCESIRAEAVDYFRLPSQQRDDANRRHRWQGRKLRINSIGLEGGTPCPGCPGGLKQVTIPAGTSFEMADTESAELETQNWKCGTGNANIDA